MTPAFVALMVSDLAYFCSAGVLIAVTPLFAVGILGHYLVTSLVMLVLLRVLLGAAEALYLVADVAALADLAPPGRAGEALSINSLALYVGVAVGPMIGLPGSRNTRCTCPR